MKHGTVISPDSTNLDVLRALAVLLVLSSHLVLALGGNARMADPLGRLGVWLFFVHTCSVLMASMERHRGIASFYVRRAFRIYPLSIVVVLAYYFIPLPGQWPLGTMAARTPALLISNLFLVQNIIYGSFSIEHNVLSPLWSLPLEVQMYAVLPLLYRARRMNIELLWVLSVVVAIAWIHIPVLRPLSITYFAPCFLSGVVAYRHSHTADRTISRRYWLPMLLLSVPTFMIFFRSIVGYLICLIVGIAIPRFQEMRPSRIARLIARYSYSIYLGHMFCLWIAFHVVPSRPMPLRWCIFIALTMAVPAGLYHSIEAPMMRAGAKLAAKLRSPFPAPSLSLQLKGDGSQHDVLGGEGTANACVSHAAKSANSSCPR